MAYSVRTKGALNLQKYRHIIPPEHLRIEHQEKEELEPTEIPIERITSDTLFNFQIL